MANDLKPGDRLVLKEEFHSHRKVHTAVVAPLGRTRANRDQFRVIYDGATDPVPSKTYMWEKAK